MEYVSSKKEKERNVEYVSSEKEKERNVEYVSSEKEKENKNEEEKENKEEKEKGTFLDHFHLYFSHYSYVTCHACLKVC